MTKRLMTLWIGGEMVDDVMVWWQNDSIPSKYSRENYICCLKRQKKAGCYSDKVSFFMMPSHISCGTVLPKFYHVNIKVFYHVNIKVIYQCNGSLSKVYDDVNDDEAARQ